MDVSKQIFVNANDTTASNSMYLSFDAESTMSSAAFKTIEASDIEIYNTDAVDCSINTAHLNSTLEADVDELVKSPVKTVKRASQNAVTSPLRVFSKNIMKEFNAICSTPSKEQLMRSVDVKRGSDNEVCFDLGAAFKGIDDEKKAHFEVVANNVENKENAQTVNESADASQLSVSASVEVLSLAVEQKLAMLSTTDEESVIETKQATIISASLLQDKKDDEATPKPTPKSAKKVKPAAVSAIPKHRRSVLPVKNSRKSVCEPSLVNNRPSRIIDARKRTSLIPIDKKLAKVTTDNIPQLIDRMLKISDNLNEIQANKPAANIAAKTAQTTNANQAPVIKKRNSVLPNAQAEKRPFAFTQRMSVVVKTTLNSPARKIPRRSVMPVATTARSAMRLVEQKITTTQRRSFMPTNKSLATGKDTAQVTKLASVTERATSSKIIVRQSMCPLPSSLQRENIKSENKAKPSQSRKSLAAKAETLYKCSFCDSKFRIKSLLDAHKRSHEGDITPAPANVKKQAVNVLTTSQTSSNSSMSTNNKCKYCDKKFALVRALHIHLLEKCTKIPPGDKRKLEYTEMDHVEKAQLPHFHHHANPSNGAVSKGTLQKAHSNLSSAPMSSTESLVDKDKTVLRRDTHKPNGSGELATTPDNVVTNMAPPVSSTKIIKKFPHAGVYRTPSKSLPCHLCKQSFRSILDYTNHSMTAHCSTAAATKSAEATHSDTKST